MRRAVTLAGLAIVNIAVLFAFQAYLLAVLGPGRPTDALFAALVLPDIVGGVLRGPVASVLVTVLAVTGARVDEVAWTLLFVVTAIVAPGVLLAALTAAWWVPLCVPGFAPAEQQLAIALARVLLVGVWANAAAAVLEARYQAVHRFVRLELNHIAAATMSLVLLVAGLATGGIWVAAWAIALRPFVQLVGLLPALGWPKAPDWNDPLLKETWRRVWPLSLGAAYYKTEPLVDRLLASLAPAGQLSLLSFAQQIYLAASQVLNKSLVQPAVPRLAQAARDARWADYRRSIRRRGIVLVLGTAAALVALALAGRPLLAALLGWGAFTADDKTRLWWLLLALGGVLLGSALTQLLAAASYARGNTRMPTAVGMVSYTAGIGLKVILGWWWGVVGIAVAASLQQTVAAAAIAVLLARQPAVRGHDRAHVQNEG